MFCFQLALVHEDSIWQLKENLLTTTISCHCSTWLSEIEILFLDIVSCLLIKTFSVNRFSKNVNFFFLIRRTTSLFPFLLCETLRKILQFYLISWCRNFSERHSFHSVSDDSPETLWKLRLFVKLPHQEN